MNKKPTLKSSLQALLYLAPMLTISGIFTIFPIFKSIAMSFYTKFNLFTGEVSARGLDNYRTVLTDKNFHAALRNTVIYVIGVVPTTIFISLLIAMMLNSIPFLKGIFRTVYFLPYVTSTVAVSVVWSWLYHSRYGFFNYILGLFGVDAINWLNSPDNALPAVMIMAIWKGLGFNILLLLVGLGNINENYYKAAKIDGANAFRRFTNITIPLLRPTLFLLSTLGVISGFKVFDEVYALFSGRPGPAGSATTLVYYLFQKFYVQFKYGEAAATGIILFVIVLGITLVQNAGNRYLEKRGG
ncbi:sugar ABC transporter permease [Aerococcaceae bacterium zg-ZUI334]|uniref:carbohydrate ABC transporter permease n=1 Tax=Aerococcaceae TaxID=186827 RepID=UPI0013B8B119|nr:MULTISPECIES: sugar ABC transporter permease [unclassified Facklamia]MBR7926735.1 sugar ABC transporter permease [Aerococcaceae bacterium zg-ZUI334]MBS4461686.1 sugar ABC transporter permease [Aerococcaceae bacterium zg-B36]QQD65320.1 sugar ABC transporter permease [Aerococcaceae bacterium zg-252]NEW63975.1 ABC transporter permease subunit [Facklamia sp. 252]NEW67446.1 ABC transporter permease subunit [Facklamia sp. 253]